jgi:hypothetical protein
MLISEDCMSPPAAVGAKAEEMNTAAPGWVILLKTPAIKPAH